MSRFWSETVHRLVPYVPGEQRTGTDVVKLNTNENPYPPSPAVLAAIADVDGTALRRYPDAESTALRTALAARHGLDPAQVFVGNGSDEILAFSFLAFFTGGSSTERGPTDRGPTERGPLAYPLPGYGFYPVYCSLYGIEMSPLVLDPDDDFLLDPERFDPAAGGIVFANPNAPTGRAISLSTIEALLERVPDRVVLIDEAYAGLGADSAIPLVCRYPNLVISRTFSKGRSLAGLRLGVAYAQHELIDGLQRVKNSFNSYPVDALAQAAGLASIGDETTYREQLALIVATRERFRASLQSRGFHVVPSVANFVFTRPPHGEAAALARQLSDAGVLVRHWSTPAIRDWLRISIGTDEDMQRLLAVIDA